MKTWPCLLLILFILIRVEASAKVYPFDDKDKDSTMVYVSIPIRVSAEGYKDFYLEAFYTNKKSLFINVEVLYRTLNIACKAGPKENTLSGFIGDESHPYLIDYDAKQIKVGNTTISNQSGLIKEQNAIYLESSLFTETFGINMTFNYRELSVRLKANFELPLIKQTRIEKMRANLSRIKGAQLADTVLQRNYHLFKFGTMDWMAASAQSWKISNKLPVGSGSENDIQTVQIPNRTINNQLGIGVGTELLFGEADVYVNYNDRQKFDNQQLYYLWRWVDNNNPMIKQAQLGTISTQTVSFIDAPIVGASIRNAATTLRKATGYYTINEFTFPNWDVELYINDAMVDHTRSDATGIYMFKVPNVYGYSTLKLKFYGPMGEERTEERTINVPYTLMPKYELEYGLTGGFVQDSLSSRFGRGEFNFGVNRFLTIGGGFEYLSSIPTRGMIPYLTATFQPTNKLTLYGEYDRGVKIRGLMNYYIGKDILLELDYAKFVEGQQATRFNAPEERKAKLSIPFRDKLLNGFARFDYAQLLYKTFTYNQSGVMVTANYLNFGANSYTQLNWIGQCAPFITSDLILSYRFLNNYIIRPSAQYNAGKNMFSTYKVEVEKYIPNGLLSLSYQRNSIMRDYYITVNFKYDLNFARTNSAASLTRTRMYTSQSAQGSLAFGSGNQYTHKSNNPSMSKGGISLYPFLDLNHNGIFDPGEPMVNINTALRISGGKINYNKKDSILRITELTAFTSYIIEFKDNNLENIFWRFRKKTYQIVIDPNQFKRINIPIVIVGEVNGMAYKHVGNDLQGMGRIQIKIYDKNTNKLIGETLSESDGFYSYMGLDPGEYVARVDSTQLSNLFMIAEPDRKDFITKESKEGEIVSNVDFVLQSGFNGLLALDNTPLIDPNFQIKQQPILIKDSTDLPGLINYTQNIQPVDASLPVTESRKFAYLGLLAANVDMIIKDTLINVVENYLFDVELFSNSTPVLAKEYFVQLLKVMPGLKVIESFGNDNKYHYSAGIFMNNEDAEQFMSFIKENGYQFAKVTYYTGGKCKIITFNIK
jgi:hypothetical protein